MIVFSRSAFTELTDQEDKSSTTTISRKMVPSPPQPTAGSPHIPPTTAADSQPLPTTVKDTTPGTVPDENSEKEKVEFFTLSLKVRKYVCPWRLQMVKRSFTICVWTPFVDLNPVLLMGFLCGSKHRVIKFGRDVLKQDFKIF